MKKILLLLIPLAIFAFYLGHHQPAKATISSSFCTPPNTPNTDWTITAPCVLYENYNGAANANLTLQSGTALTLHNGKHLVWYPGKSITIQTGASIIVNTGSEITQKKLCVNAVAVPGASGGITLGPGETVTVGYNTTIYTDQGYLKLTYKTIGGGVTVQRTLSANNLPNNQNYNFPDSSTYTTTTLSSESGSCAISGSDQITLKNMSSSNTIIISYADVGLNHICGDVSISKTWNAYYGVALTGTDPTTGGNTLYLGADQTAAADCTTLGANYVDAVQIADRNLISMSGSPTNPGFLAASYRYLLNLGMAVNSINSGAKVVQAAGNNVQVVGDNFFVCGPNSNSTCPTSGFSNYGNIYVSGNIGVGTTNPTSALSVVGSSGNPSLTHNAAGIAQYSDDNVQLALTRQAASPFTFSLQTRHAVSDGNSYPLALNPLGGNVGIGTTAPSGNLDVFGTAKDIRIGDTSTGYSALRLLGSNTDDIAYIQAGVSSTDTSANLTISRYTSVSSNLANLKIYADKTNFSNDVYVSGNVGIGTTAPSTYLDIQGTETATTGTTRNFISATTRTATLTADSTIVGVDSTTLDHMTENGFNAYNYAGNFTAYADGTQTFNWQRGINATAYSTSTSATNQDSIGGAVLTGYLNSSGTATNVFGSYNQGYNTSTGTVTQAIGVYGLGFTNNSGSVTTAYGTFGNAFTSNGPITTAIGAQGNAYSISGNITTARGLASRVYRLAGTGTLTTGEGVYTSCEDFVTCYGVYINTGDAQVTTDWGLYVNGAADNYMQGNLGIGTTAPTQAIELASGGIIQLNSGNIQDYGDVTIKADADNNSTNVIKFLNGAGGEIMRLQEAGNVGIGSTSPQGTLDIAFATATYAIRFTRAGAVLGDIFKNTSGPLTIGSYANGTTNATINLSGNTGVNNASPGYALDVTGQVHISNFTGTGGVPAYENAGVLGVQSSDLRLKENIKTQENALDKVMKLRGVNFNFKNDPEKRMALGFIAQEVQPIVPEAVFSYKNNEGQTFYGVYYAELTSLLTNAIKDQQKEIDSLKQEIEAIKNKL